TVAQIPAHAHSEPDGTTGITGGSQRFDDMQPALGLHYIIAPSGIAAYLPEVRLFAGNFEPNSWLFADGRSLDIATHEVLYGEIGTTYGGDGVNPFALPDLQGRVAVGAGQGPGLSNRMLGERPGAESVTLSVAQMPSHTHTLSGGGTTGATGGSQPFDNTQPSLAVNYMVTLDGIFPSHDGVYEDITPLMGEVRPFAGGTVPLGWALA